MNLFKQLQSTLKGCSTTSANTLSSISNQSVVDSTNVDVAAESLRAAASSDVDSRSLYSHYSHSASDLDRTSCQSELDAIFRSAIPNSPFQLNHPVTPTPYASDIANASAVVSGVIQHGSNSRSPLIQAVASSSASVNNPHPNDNDSDSDSDTASPQSSSRPNNMMQEDTIMIDRRKNDHALVRNDRAVEDVLDDCMNADVDDGMDESSDHDVVNAEEMEPPQQEFTHYRDIGLQSQPLQPSIRLPMQQQAALSKSPNTARPPVRESPRFVQAPTATSTASSVEFSPVPFGFGPFGRSSLHVTNEQKDESHSQVFMSIYRPQQTSKFGVAYYSIADETLYGGEFSDLSAVQMLKYKIQPDVLVTTSASTQELYQQLMSNEFDPEHGFHVKTVSKQEFSIDSAIQRLRLLRVEDLWDVGESNDDTEEAAANVDKLHHTLLLRSVVDFQQTVMLSAMGGLIYHLLQSAVFSQLEVDRLRKPVHIKCIKSIPTADVLMIDRGSMEGLGIFIQEPHPGTTNRSKEGFSVFALLNQTKTAQGSRTLRRWLENPTTNLDTIERRQDHVEYFSLVENSDLVGQLRSNLRYVRDISRLIIKFHNRQASLVDWKTFVAALRHLLAICELLSDRRDDLALFRSLYELFSNKLQRLLEEIEHIVQLEASEEASSEEGDDSAHVQAGIDDKLDHLRCIFSNLDRICQDEVVKDLQVVSNILPQHIVAEYILTYLPQIGFLARVPVGDEGVESFRSKLETEAKAELKFHTTEHAYFKSTTASKLDGVYGDLQGVIVDLENAILKELQSHILQCADSLKQINEKVAELDCYLSLAIAAIQHNLVRPEITHDPVLVIQHGRHMLQEKRVESFVANSTALGIQKGSLIHTESMHEEEIDESGLSGGGLIHIITGPNNSGKSVYLKQVGIITYLAHTGSFVPASKATIGICDSILTRVKGLDSINSSYSTFAYDTSQVAYMLRHCTRRSLCLIDEYGKGTSNLDGVALLAATIQHFEEQGTGCPKVLIATHFHELYTRKLIEESETISFWKMDFLEQEPIDDQGSNSEEAVPAEKRAKRSDDERKVQAKSSPQMSPIVCLYKLVPGVSKRSFGTNCALNAGVTETILIRANQVANQIAGGTAIEPIDLLPGSALPSTATPFSFQPQEEEVWFQFLAFVLFSTGHRPTSEVAHDASEQIVKQQLQQDIQAGRIDAEPLLLDISTGQLEGLYVQFMQQQKPLLIARLRPNSVHVNDFDLLG